MGYSRTNHRILF